MNAEPSDHSWLRDFHGGFLLEGYTLTLVRGLSPQRFLDRLGADPQGDVADFDAFVARDRDFQDDQDEWGDYMFVGATLVQGKNADWVLALEINGGIEIRTDAMMRATLGTRGVSHFRSPNAMSLFSWWEDGELRTRFEGPLHRDGSTPDELVDLMHQVGFDFEDGSCDLEDYIALAEELTGVQVTPDMLENSTYSTGIVEIPTDDWTSVVIDVTDAHGTRAYVELPNPTCEQH
ncbi:hypothetical protein AAW14_00250 [Streptomyces hygroscopicus]|uniref:DUF6461 domain-containing protein n=1 Tax=Streptomyces hygroscopicus TaxID=1912 RepID=UPI00223F33FF|nr:DUF6461 domain-containing protein [Streptomyces hygroscopicus]MCW7940540.1 hypothetical protein [Streptomyces hygroscopicus]